LRQMMNEAGVTLSGFSVKSESSNSSAQFTGERSSSHSKKNETANVTSTSAIGASINTVKRPAANGIVDTFA
jgi:flagellar hook-length control protein FliK